MESKAIGKTGSFTFQVVWRVGLSLGLMWLAAGFICRLHACSGELPVGFEVSNILPVEQGALVVGALDGDFAIARIASSHHGQPCPPFGEQGVLRMGAGRAVDIIPLDWGYGAAGNINHQGVIIRFDLSGRLLVGFGRQGRQLLDWHPGVLAWDADRRRIIAASAGHSQVHWQTFDPDTGQELDRHSYPAPADSYFHYWLMPVALTSGEPGWLLAATLSNGDYQKHGVFIINRDYLLTESLTESLNKPKNEGFMGGYLDLPGIHQLTSLQWQDGAIQVIGASGNGEYWLDQYLSGRQQPISYILRHQAITAAAANGTTLLTASQPQQQTILAEQPLIAGKPGAYRPILLLPGSFEIERISVAGDSIWFTGRAGEGAFIGQADWPPSVTQPSSNGGQHAQRQKRQAQGCGEITGATQVCAGGATCTTNNGFIFVARITNDISTLINSNISSFVNTSIDTEINSLVNISTRIETTIRTTVAATAIVRTRLNFDNAISTQLSAEAGTVKADLDGNFILDNRIATLETDLDVSARAQLRLFSRFEGLSANLTTLVRTDADLQAEVSGVRASLAGNTAATSSGGLLGGLIAGTIVGVGACSLRSLLWLALIAAASKIKGACVTAVCGPLGALYQCCH